MSGIGRRAKLAIAVAGLALLAVATLTVLRDPDAAGASGLDPIVLGHSVEGRAITAVRVGDPTSPRKALVLGVIHGDEPAGAAVTRQILRRYRGIGGVDLWVVKTVNPDGLAHHTRRNAHGVDLNRNFSYRWRDGVPPSSGYYPGPHPFSEPESRAVRKLVRQLQPQVSIWFHQPWDQVLAPCHGDASLQRRFSQLSGIPEALPWRGSARHRDRLAAAHFPRHPCVRGRARGRIDLRPRREARRASGREGDPGRGGDRLLRRRRETRRCLIGAAPGDQPQADPFPPHRRREMAAYSKRHYGKAKWRLTNPHVIVEHISVTDSISALYNTFAPDHPDPELHELPNVCSHFGVGSNGRIYQFVRLDTRCRHTVGLNYTAIGVEHVGFKDSDVLGNARQLHASLRLTQYLRCRFGIKIRNVIGHNESLSSPYHLELVPSLKHQTHGDWKHASMQIYRRKLRHLGPC